MGLINFLGFVGQPAKFYTDIYEANKEIERLNILLSMGNLSSYKRPVGRPKKKKQKITKRFAGAPRKYGSLEEMENELVELEDAKAQFSKELDKKKLSDKAFFEHIVFKHHPKLRLWRHDKKTQAVKILCKKYKYFRDQTGIRQN